MLRSTTTSVPPARIARIWRGWACAGLLLAAPLTLAPTFGACKDDSCAVDGDCGEGMICRVGLCARSFSDTALPDGLDVSLDCDPAAAGDLVMNEILADPPSGSDANGDGVPSTTQDEFVEIVNVASRPVGLSNVEIEVAGKGRTVAGFYCLNPNDARTVFGSDGLDGLTNGGATVSLLIDGLTVQTHSYGAEGGKNASLTLETQLDPNSNWVVHNEVWATAFSAGTCSNGNPFPDCSGPGNVEQEGDVVASDVAPPSCTTVPAVGDLLINEILADPGSNDANQDGLPDGSDDEFVEVVNTQSVALLMTGISLREGGGKTFTFPPSCIPADGAAVVFAVYEGTGSFGDALVFGKGSTWSLNNSGDTISLLDPADGVLDTVSYGSEGGHDESLTRAIDGAISSEFVRHSAHPLSGGAMMSPGTCARGTAFPDCGDTTAEVTPPADTTDGGGGEDVAPPCGDPATIGDLVLNEVLANGGGVDWNQDGVADASEDEFVEVVSVAATTVSLDGVSLVDAASNTMTFGAVCIEPGEVVVVFGDGDPWSTTSLPVNNIPSQIDLPALNNGAETLSLNDASGAVIDSYSHSSAKVGQSRVRAPDITGDWVDHSDANGTIGNGSPGLCLNGEVFPSCAAATAL